MTYLLLLFYIIVALFVIYKATFFTSSGIKTEFLLGAFLVKLISCIAFWYVYTYYYTDRCNADMYKYFDDSKVLFDALKSSPLDYLKMLFGLDFDTTYFRENYYVKMDHWYREWQRPYFNDNITMIRINAFFRLFSFGNIHIHNLFSSFLSFIGLVALYKTFYKYIEKKTWLAIGLFLLPSTLFWASAILKESILIFALGLFVYSWFKLLNKHWKYGINFILSAFLMLYLKTYIILILIPLLTAHLIHKIKPSIKPVWSFFLVITIFFGASLYLRTIDRNYDVYRSIFKKQDDFLRLAREANSGSILHVKPLAPTFKSFINNFPEALYNSFFLRWPWQVHSFFELFSSMENLLLIALFMLAFIKKQPLSGKINEWLLCFLFVFMLFLLIGYTTPVLGAIVRYRVPALPFLLISGLMMLNKNVFLFKEKYWDSWIIKKQP